MNPIYRLIRGAFQTYKAFKIKRKAQLNNPHPKTWRKWEYNSWGYKISFRSIDNKRNIIHIVGWLPERPKNGDYLIYSFDKDKYAKGVIYNVEYVTNPPDMFFADVKPLEEVKL